MKLRFLSAALLAAVAGTTFANTANADVNVYSYRQEFLIRPILDQFTKETGIKVNVVYLKKGLSERLQTEGKLSPADIVLTVDISRLEDLVKKGLTQPIQSDVVNANIPSYMHGTNWVALTQRARAVYTSKERVGHLPVEFTYMDLAKPEYKGKICTRSGKHPYNVSLVASIIEHHGLKAAKAWLQGVKNNLARKPQGNDRDQIKGIANGVCDYALGNSYYFGHLINSKEASEREAAAKVFINFPNQDTTGTHMNVSGVALTKYAPHKEEAIKLINFLSSDEAQRLYAEVNYEYPVKPGVPLSALVNSWGTFMKDEVDIVKVAGHYEEALKLIDEVQFDL